MGAHLAFALHYFAFLYLITAAAGASRRFGVGQEFAAAVALGISGTYLFLAVRRVYPGSARRVCFEWAVLMLLTLVCNYLANLIAIRVTLALL